MRGRKLVASVDFDGFERATRDSAKVGRWEGRVCGGAEGGVAGKGVAPLKPSMAFVHIPKDERSKLDDKTKPCIFLGYAHEEFDYRLWDPINRKIIRSRDVVFLEDQVAHDAKEKPESNSEVPVNLDPTTRRFDPHEYVMLTDGGEPQSFAEAMAHDQNEK
ncbi:hypothetical protein SASPL_104454 [Salvia splendens]|uniref:Retroviral polymerase SH3-like domain-containing protein n=1 Tax=Salvia splendens TaxID=180675 RepID=A0A8X9A9U3_SALSN|nr:hypothetical protein SASPL_104454 [Salvia splendens]